MCVSDIEFIYTLPDICKGYTFTHKIGDRRMIDVVNLLNLQGQLFLLLLTGFFFRKFIVGETFQKELTSVIINLILPCNIITSFKIEMDNALLTGSLLTLLVSLINQIGCLLLAGLLFRWCTRENQPVMKYGMLCSNAGFLGTPIAEGIWGSEGILLAAIFLIPQRVFMWTAGLSFFERGSKTNFVSKLLKNPCIDAVIFGLVLMITRFQLPTALDDAITAFSRCNTGISMFLIGMVASKIKLKDFVDKEILYLSAIRLIILPFVSLSCCWLLRIDGLARGISVILTAMPVGGTTAVLAAKYDRSPEFAAGCVATSTILSLIAIPLWGMVL